MRYEVLGTDIGIGNQYKNMKYYLMKTETSILIK